jgi:hypothetical protein
MNRSSYCDALLLVASVRAAIINQTKHYAVDGRFLGTEKEIMEELLKQREITFDVSNSLELTTEKEQFEIIRREYLPRRDVTFVEKTEFVHQCG